MRLMSNAASRLYSIGPGDEATLVAKKPGLQSLLTFMSRIAVQHSYNN